MQQAPYKSVRKTQFDSTDEMRDAALHAFRQIKCQHFKNDLKGFREHGQHIETGGVYII